MAKKKSVRVYQRGKTWTYSYETERVDGKRKPITKGGFATEEEAYKAGMAALSDFLNGIVTKEPVKISYGDFMIHWLENIYIHEVKKKSYITIFNVCKRHIIPGLGTIRLTDLSRVHIKDFLNKKTDEGYSRATIQFIKVIIGRSLKAAIKDYSYISENPARELPLPKTAQQRLPRTRIALTKEQQTYILNQFAPCSNEYIALMLGLHCGLRIGEAVAVTWDNIDFQNKTLNIDKQFSSSEGTPCIDYPKNNSQRIISIDDAMIELLKSLKNQRLKEKLKAAVYYDSLKYIDARHENEISDFDLILRKKNGVAYSIQMLYYQLRLLKKRLDFAFDFHTLRHTHCTELIAAGAPIKAVQKRMGHKNIELTLNIYTSVNDDMDRQLSDVMNVYLYAK